jgi:parvulin-like peptidyl-prolyl isomerase
MEMTDVLVLVNGKEIRVEEVIGYLKARGIFRDAVCRMAEIEVLKDKSKELGIALTEDEVRDFSDRKRRFWNLSADEQLQAYCVRHGITQEHWWGLVRNELLQEKIRAAVVTDKAVKKYFETNSARLRSVSASRIVCAERKQAEKLLSDISDQGEPFSVMARKHSIEKNTSVAGGYLGAITRGMLPVESDAAVFAGKPGDIIGPFPENGSWSLYRIEEVRDIALSDSLRQEISERLFRQWLQRTIAEARLERPAG